LRLIWYISMIILLSFTELKSQYCVSINGRVLDSVKTPLQSVIVSISILGKKKFSISNYRGEYTVNICHPNDSILKQSAIISFNLIGYDGKTINHKVGEGKNSIEDVFLVYKDTHLKEVIVRNRSIVQRGDTTAFTVGAFKNKLDANLEDVLKKMPGFDIDESGRILYNNKPIETILIEGDELAKNYKLISKNIPPDAIDKVEMIDKYEVNPLLKGLTRSRKQAMNLTLKNPNHVSTFGNLKIGTGIKSKQNFTGDLFAINKATKTMVLGNKNNIGVSPYDEITFDQKNIQSKDYEFDNTLIPVQIVENSLFAKPLFNTVSNNLFNHSQMGTINSSVRVNSTLSAKLFSDVYSDNIYQFQEYNFQNLIFPSLSYKTVTEKRFLPNNVNVYGQIKYLTKKTQLLITGAYSNKKYEEIDSITSTLNYLSNLYSRYKRIGTGGYFTYRIDSSNVFELSIQYLDDIKNQKI